ncbi:sigma-70 family RNA polymerase sigma factor [Actinomycetospora corticicola]|uniref:RNA polymerase sigma-70 factor (ECF subfamily) n=1 Tax=Actinomycetospora corticicola TaxID=663602 RepID=A0A7Y9E2S2_9PSEU|nr:RNA polymerase sigma-70 factor (ECF subfamily) [Actinomycetospora corticicola]
MSSPDPSSGGDGAAAASKPGRAGHGWDGAADEWLIAQAVSGSKFSGQAFEVLLRRHRDRIYRIALRLTGDPVDAQDVAQDVAVQLWRALAGFTGSSTFSTWLYRIVVNRSLNHRRAQRVPGRRTEVLGEADHPTVRGPEPRVLDAARLDAAGAALSALPAEQRAAVVLCQIEGLSYREAAAIVGVSEAALRSRLERGRRNLVAAMREWT